MRDLINQLLLLSEAESIAIDPKMIITEWVIFDAIFFDGTQSSHLVGQVLAKGERVSSEITSFFPETKTIITRSGREYKLIGYPGISCNGDVWVKWAALYKVVSYQNITDQYAQKIRNIIN